MTCNRTSYNAFRSVATLALGFLATACLSTNSHAGKDLPFCQDVSAVWAKRVDMGSVLLEESTLSDLQKNFGNAEVTSRKVEECCIERTVCYVSGKGDLALVFGAYSGEHVTSFEVTRDEQRIASLKHCSVVPNLEEPSTNTVGVKLGEKRSHITRLLGDKGLVSYSPSNEIGYEHACIRSDMKPEGWRRYTSIRVNFDDQGRVSTYMVSQTTQN